jgi:uncharacterized SAM-binding protein YcdF (DUF218 family)
MLFTLKKFIGGLLLPLPLFLLIMGFSLLLLWFTRRQKTAKVLLSLSWLGLLLLSLQPVADWLLAPLESRYSTYTHSAPVDYIVVLGGGYTFNPHWAPSSNLINNSLPRVTEAIRIYRQNPHSKLIFTGGRAKGNPVASAEVAGLVAESLGVERSDIIMLDNGKDTEDEARLVADLIGDKTMVLVTSANHLPRAIVWFEKQGLSPIPAPANQLAITTPLNPWEKSLPTAYYLSHSERAWYETIGQLWQKIKTDNDD